MFTSYKTTLVTPDEALPGHPNRLFPVPERHAVLGTPLEGPFPAGIAVMYVGMGCFWGAEKKMWQLPGVYTTAVGYQGGYSPNPTYEEVCTGRTGHAENVLIAYDPSVLSHYDLLKVFWENHDPTQGYRQGNDIGTQYRSALYFTSDEQQDVVEATAVVYDRVLRDRRIGEVTTEIAPADEAQRPFYYAEDYHQQYLFKVPHGYDCHANTGIALPAL